MKSVANPSAMSAPVPGVDTAADHTSQAPEIWGGLATRLIAVLKS